MLLMVAVSGYGIVASYTILGGWKGNYVAIFLQEFLFPLIKGQSRLLLFDNAKCHHTGTVEAIVAHKEHCIQFIPPYLLWLNLTEQVFGCIRPAIGWENLKDSVTLEKVIDNCLSLIASKQAKGWIRKTKKWAQVASAGCLLNQDHDANQALARYGLFQANDPKPMAPANGGCWLLLANQANDRGLVGQPTTSQRGCLAVGRLMASIRAADRERTCRSRRCGEGILKLRSESGALRMRMSVATD